MGRPGWRVGGRDGREGSLGKARRTGKRLRAKPDSTANEALAGMNCEMCGADFPRLKRARVEGMIMNVCNDCTRFGEVIEAPRPAAAQSGPGAIQDRLAERQRKATPKNVLDSMQKELVEGFGERIRKAREKKGWTREQLADRIHQPVPTVTKFESEKMVPSDKAVSHLERELGIKLMEAVPQGQMVQRDTSAAPSRGLTLGDLIKDAQKKK